MSMRLLVCGDRDWTDFGAIKGRIALIGPGLIIEGGARGADRLAGMAAEALGVPVHIFVADWHRHGKAAGVLRNQEMLDKGKPDLVLAFHDNIEASKGTKDMVSRAKKAGLPVEVWSHATSPSSPSAKSSAPHQAGPPESRR